MSDPVDRRAAERMPVNAGTGCTYGGVITADIGSVRVRDVSLNGIGVILSKKVEVGAQLVITLTNPEKGVNKTILLKVAHVTSVPGGFLVGGAFAEPLTYQELTGMVL